MLFDGLLIEHQCRPQAVAAAGTSGTIVYRNLFLSSLLGRPIQCLSVLISAGLVAPTHNSTQMSLRLPILAHSDHPTLSLAVDIAASLLGLMIHMI
jgi:uncharacterized membrane protein